MEFHYRYLEYFSALLWTEVREGLIVVSVRTVRTVREALNGP